MNRSILFSSVFLVLSVCGFAWTQGLECYWCIHIDSDNLPDWMAELIEESCQEGKTPESRLLTECPSRQVCGKFHANRTTPELGSAEISGRACVEKIDDLFDKCVVDKNVTELSQYQDQALQTFLTYIPEDEIPSICSSESNDFKDGSTFS